MRINKKIFEQPKGGSGVLFQSRKLQVDVIVGSKCRKACADFIEFLAEFSRSKIAGTEIREVFECKLNFFAVVFSDVEDIIEREKLVFRVLQIVQFYVWIDIEKSDILFIVKKGGFGFF